MEKIFSQFSLLETESISQPLKGIFSFPILHIDERNNKMITIPTISKIPTLIPYGRVVIIPTCFHIPKKVQLVSTGNLETQGIGITVTWS